MKANGGPWDGQDVEDVWDNQDGLLLVDRPQDRVWVYDRVATPDGDQLDVREDEGRLLDDDKRFVAGDDPKWAVRVVDNAEVEEEVGL
jgi:hypothetical protein